MPAPVSPAIRACCDPYYRSPTNQISDFAWRNFKERHLYTQSAKERIEERFKKDMLDVCEDKSGISKWTCESSAGLYASVVSKWPANEAHDVKTWELGDQWT